MSGVFVLSVCAGAAALMLAGSAKGIHRYVGFALAAVAFIIAFYALLELL